MKGFIITAKIEPKLKQRVITENFDYISKIL